ncbi:hypothetical protein P5673_020191 [Acropora cervicornis]|uniref:Uncharacterized protein n=1 Tax=Acropora cervicornis TaxID=6130 RepID=A0AAD9QA35_ACRCE|nr:hypothetical protein P5673_020191 [Acropora cervicornis]
MLVLFKFKEKPYAHQGPIITIKLSENTENVTASHGSQQTSYDTGLWRCFKRTRDELKLKEKIGLSWF